MSDINMGANTAPAESAAPEAATQETTTVQETATAENTESIPQTEQAESSRIDKAFAARLRKEQEKLEKQYSSHKYVIERAAQENGMTVEEYLNAVKQQYEDKEFENLDPSIKEDIKWAREQRARQMSEMQKMQESSKWQNEIKSLLERFPDVKSAQDIPDEVLESHIQTGIPLRYAYADYALGKERTKIEQETLKKIQDNTRSSPGSLGGSATDAKTRISEMSQSEFDKLKDEVLRGTRKSL